MLVAILPSAAQERGRVRGVRKLREILQDNSQKRVNRLDDPNRYYEKSCQLTSPSVPLVAYDLF